MKIDINYELISKIGEYNTGFNVNRVGKKFGFLTSIGSIMLITVNMNDPKEMISDLIYIFSVASMQTFGMEFISRRMNKLHADEQLRELSMKLNGLGVNTDEGLLAKAEVYDVKYKLEFNNRIFPRLLQNKYIMVPTRNEGEVSLVQEHVIGKGGYNISVGEPDRKKQYKLVYNGI